MGQRKRLVLAPISTDTADAAFDAALDAWVARDRAMLAAVVGSAEERVAAVAEWAVELRRACELAGPEVTPEAAS